MNQPARCLKETPGFFWQEEFMDTQNNTLTIREYPLGEWGFGILMFAIAGFTAVGARGGWSISLIAGGAGVLFILFATILVVQADRVNGTLTIRRISVLRRYVREIPIAAIAALQLEASRSSSSTSNPEGSRLRQRQISSSSIETRCGAGTRRSAPGR